MADFSPPDRTRSASTRTGDNGGTSSGKVVDFRYKRPSQSDPRINRKPSPPDGAVAPKVGGNAALHDPSAHNGAKRRQAYAALDLGTNNCRLLIARPEG